MCISVTVPLIYCDRDGDYSEETVCNAEKETQSTDPYGISAKPLTCNHIFKEWHVSCSIFFGDVGNMGSEVTL